MIVNNSSKNNNNKINSKNKIKIIMKYMITSPLKSMLFQTKKKSKNYWYAKFVKVKLAKIVF